MLGRLLLEIGRLLFAIPLFLFSCRSPGKTGKFADCVDSLRTDQDILNFVRRIEPPPYGHTGLHGYAGLVLDPPQSKRAEANAFHLQYRRQMDSFGARTYEKIDLDDNGYTDLLFNGYDSIHPGYHSMAILFFGKDSFCIRELPKEFNPEFFAARSIRIDGKPFLQTLTTFYTSEEYQTIYHGEPRYLKNRFIARRCDTLTWISFWPVEKRPHFPHSVDTLRYDFGGFLGAFHLTLIGNSVTLDRIFEFHQGKLADPYDTLVARLDSTTARSLYNIIYAIDWERLDSFYEPPASDVSSGVFDLTYDGGKTKTVVDCGLIGTYGLAALEDMLIGFRDSLSWKRITYTHPTTPPATPHAPPASAGLSSATSAHAAGSMPPYPPTRSGTRPGAVARSPRRSPRGPCRCPAS